VVRLVSDNLLDHRDRIIGDHGHGFELLSGLGKRLLNRGRVALIRALHRDADDRARSEVDGVFGLVR
jgi:hypothetical protein